MHKITSSLANTRGEQLSWEHGRVKRQTSKRIYWKRFLWKWLAQSTAQNRYSIFHLYLLSQFLENQSFTTFIFPWLLIFIAISGRICWAESLFFVQKFWVNSKELGWLSKTKKQGQAPGITGLPGWCIFQGRSRSAFCETVHCPLNHIWHSLGWGVRRWLKRADQTC